MSSTSSQSCLHCRLLIYTRIHYHTPFIIISPLLINVCSLYHFDLPILAALALWFLGTLQRLQLTYQNLTGRTITWLPFGIPYHIALHSLDKRTELLFFLSQEPETHKICHIYSIAFQRDTRSQYSLSCCTIYLPNAALLSLTAAMWNTLPSHACQVKCAKQIPHTYRSTFSSSSLT